MKPNEEFIRLAQEVIDKNSVAGHFFVLAADITGFHTVNHIYGTKTGDELLARLDTVLSDWPNMQLCMQLYADAFLCLFFLEDGKEIRIVANSADIEIQAFLDEWRTQYPACRLKAACGVCEVATGNLIRAIDNANVARKAAKKELSTKAVIYDEIMRNWLAARYEIEQECYQALQENRFCFYLQPKVDLTNGEIIGAEALARRVGKNGEVIYPDTFLEAMESNGAIIKLDRSICRQVCEFLAERIHKDLPVVCISVNLSRLHIEEPGAADELHAIVEEYQVPPELLEFELTETILVEEFSGAKRLIDQLRGYGHRVSIDDFGSGYAGITIWQELNFDCLKLDRKFLSDELLLKDRNEALVPNIINIAQRLHVQVLCEGVETEEQCLYLMRLGCTVVQGFYFSKPIPPDQLCQICELQGKKYPLPPALLSNVTKPEPSRAREHDRFKRPGGRIRQYMVVVVLCALFLGACITSVLTAIWHLTQREFSSMIIETLDAYTDGQRENTRLEIAGITSTLDSMAVLFGKNNDSDFIDTYLLALNEDSQDVIYAYFSYENYKKQIAEGVVRPESAETLEKLLRNETVISEVTFSERMGGIYCIGVGVPVTRNGEFIGAVRGIINAEKLVSTSLYDPAQGEIAAVFLTNCDSKVLPVRTEGGKATGELLLDRMLSWGIHEETMEELRAVFAADEERAKSVSIGIFDGDPYYLSMTGLGYNGWHLVVCLKADKALAHSQQIVHHTTVGIAGLLISVSLTSAIIISFIGRMQRRFSLEGRRYLLLERFSDTVLFDYDCRRDTIRFTSNASKLMRIHELTQIGFLRHLDEVYLYAGDQEEARRMLTGLSGTETGEVRIRLMRPDTDTYFWCMVQYQYLYEKDTLVSVVGKITDIDERMCSEEQLLRMSETDGLTGLLNKAAAEKLSAERLMKTQKGAVFILDADDFKGVNDKYGHAAGDLALRFIGDCMKRTFRTGDVLGRIGGDELLIYAEGIDSREAAHKKAELLQKHLESCTEAGVLPMTVSIGIALAPSDGKTYPALSLAADKAMYAAKQNGKRQICFYEDISNDGLKEGRQAEAEHERRKTT